MTPPSIVLENISVELSGRAILSGVSITVKKGERIALIGASGCGKTTLMHAIGGLTLLTAGTIQSAFVRPAFVFQDPRLLPWHTVTRNAEIGLIDKTMLRHERQQKAEAMLSKCGLERSDFAKYPGQLSGGMRARVALARAMLHEPDLLLLDEPFGSLDIGTRNALQRLLHNTVIGKSITMLLVTHDLREAVNLCDRLLVMSRRGGAIVADIALPNEVNIYQDWGHSSSVQKIVADVLSDPRIRAELLSE